MVQGQLTGVTWMLSENQIAGDKAPCEHSPGALGKPLTFAGCWIGDHDGASYQKRHVCDSEKLNCPGVG